MMAVEVMALVKVVGCGGGSMLVGSEEEVMGIHGHLAAYWRRQAQQILDLQGVALAVVVVGWMLPVA